MQKHFVSEDPASCITIYFGSTYVGRSELAATLQRFHFVLCDEADELTGKFLKNFKSHQHCVLFKSSCIKSNWWNDFEVAHLDSCLRSTNQLAKFANDFLEEFPGLAIYYSTVPCRCFEGENVDIKLCGEAGSSSFIHLCVRTIVEYAQKVNDVELLPVASLLEIEKLHLIKEDLEKMNYVCLLDLTLTAADDQKSANGCSRKTPVILFFDPRKYEGCEFPVVLILVDKSISVRKITDSCILYFLTAITRASLKLVIIFDESPLSDDEVLNEAMVTEKSELVETTLKMAEFLRSAKPIFLFVASYPDEEHFERELNTPQMYLPDVDGISCYVGNHSRVLHIEDVYLESDLKKLNDFGIKFIFLCNMPVECEWHSIYYYATSICISNFQRKTPVAFNIVHSIPSFLDVRKFSMKRLLTFLKQQSGESETELPRSNFKSQKPKMVTDWLKWKSKGSELYRIRVTTIAKTFYDKSILLLKTKCEKDFQLGNVLGVFKSSRELAKLYTNLSKIHLEQADGIYDEKLKHDVDFWGEILNAFDATMQAIQFDPSWSRSYERMHTIVEKVKSRYNSCSTDSCDSDFDYESKNSDFLNQFVPGLSTKINILQELEELYDTIRPCQRNFHEKSDSQLPLFGTISSKASTLSRESLEIIQLREVESGFDYDVMYSDLRLLMNQARFIFYIPVRLAMISSKYSFPTKSPEEVLHSALNKLGEVIRRIRKLGLRFEVHI